MKDFDLNRNIKPLMGLIIILMGFAYFYMCSLRNIKPDPQVLIAVVASVSAVTGYWFGSSSGSSKKDDALTSNLSNPTVDKANTVNVNTDKA